MIDAHTHIQLPAYDSDRDAVIKRARFYLSTLDKLVPNNQKVMNFYRFFNEIVSK